jgi:hypothetical protein
MAHVAAPRIGILAVGLASRSAAAQEAAAPLWTRAGWMYDSKRKLVYSFAYNGEAWALRLDPATAKPLEKPE